VILLTVAQYLIQQNEIKASGTMRKPYFLEDVQTRKMASQHAEHVDLLGANVIDLAMEEEVIDLTMSDDGKFLFF
jgi:predicted ATP-grasp superfamily ATP-dependent carboligase